MKRFAVLALILSAVSAAPAAAEKTLRIGVTGLAPSVFNPYANTGLPYTYSWSAVFDALTVIDAKGVVQPWLATSWENVDPLTWRFVLRDDVLFSDGTTMTADAAVAVGELLINIDQSRSVVARMMSFLESFRAIDARTVEIKTKIPIPLLPRFLSMFYISEPERLRRLGIDEFGRQPVATGPFVLETFAPNRATLRAHTSSWRRPQVDRLEIRAAPDAATRRAAVESGQMDIAMNMGPEETGAIIASGGKRVTWRDNSLWAFHFNGTDGTPYRYAPFNDIRVREALNIAIDRKTIIETFLENQTVAATQPGTETAFGFNPDLPPIPFDPDRARRLLAEAGHASGLNVVLEVTVGSAPNDGAIAQTVAQQLGDVGVKVEVRQISTPQLIRNVVEGTWGEAMFGLHYSLEPTADVLRGLDTASCLWPHPWYCNPATTADIRAGHAEFDPDKALALRQKVMAAYRADWPAVFMYQAVRFAGLRGNISGFAIANNYIYYDKITKD